VRIFVENQPITCTRINKGYKIDPYFNRKEVEDLLFQALLEDLEVKLWEDTRKGKGARVKIVSISPWVDVSFNPPKNNMTGLEFTVYYLDRPLRQRAIRGIWP